MIPVQLTAGWRGRSCVLFCHRIRCNARGNWQPNAGRCCSCSNDVTYTVQCIK